MKIVFLPVVLLLFLTGCQNEEEPGEIKYSYYYDKALPSLIQPVPFSGEIIGEWHYSFLFYESVISIYKNGRFHYYDEGCVSKSASAGNWIIQGAQVILNSDKEYLQEENSDMLTSSTVPTIAKADTSPVPANYKLTLPVADFRTTFKMPDTNKVYFANERFILKEGRLYRNYVGAEQHYEKRLN